MKYLHHLLMLTVCVLSLTGCAAGAATAGYALRADSANSLTAEGEDRIVRRAKREILAELHSGAN
jgi:hypothetical protein